MPASSDAHTSSVVFLPSTSSTRANALILAPTPLAASWDTSIFVPTVVSPASSPPCSTLHAASSIKATSDGVAKTGRLPLFMAMAVFASHTFVDTEASSPTVKVAILLAPNPPTQGG
eukprot:CAMPEP_0173382418 /NCGR_PEP_ID=MMETSP1356-20130122/4919_1 /TAXON_ID=77927 ORGANISM="Hemiselmis virescens, Strain PCC157" /NCGR_SAMPLE_ID=MMETSP1356 /ASSEMBLY_ACC=CAM_ASM_000847 /LENGTH=116 /DNA_ID=CAMNT_0014336743 /DNA_START=406 /DNA_END=752 /DNA_ORIENTATION=-